MKKIILTLLLLALIILLVAFAVLCFRHFYGAASDGAQGSTEDIEADRPYFTGRVLETNEKGFLLEVTDTGNGAFSVGDTVQVNVDRSQHPDYGTEDLLRITFDGKVALSYPPQVTNVISIRIENG